MSNQRPNALSRPVTLVGFVLLAAALSGCTSSQFKPVERFSATAVPVSDMSGPLPVNVIVYRYAGPEETDELGAVLRREGSRGLLTALSKHEMGRLTTSRGSGLALRMVYQVPTPTGRRIIAITDRPMGFMEFWTSSRSRDYEFAYVELTLDESGNGEGMVVRAGQIHSISAHKLLVTNYETYPIRLMAVRRR
ncbi:MAG: hypothetical protein ACYC7A_08540 [Thermoanaerobaculia bacterium]